MSHTPSKLAIPTKPCEAYNLIIIGWICIRTATMCYTLEDDVVFMTFNTWLCVAVCAGAGVGYLLFGRYRHNSTDDGEEYCH